MNIAKLHAEGRKFRSTRDKKNVRILCTDKIGQHNVVFMEDWGSQEFIVACSNNGDGLIEPVPVEREGWVVMDGTDRIDASIFDNREDAEWVAGYSETVARITWQE